MLSNIGIYDDHKDFLKQSVFIPEIHTHPLSHWLANHSFCHFGLAVHPDFEFMTNTHSQISIPSGPLRNALACGMLPSNLET